MKDSLSSLKQSVLVAFLPFHSLHDHTEVKPQPPLMGGAPPQGKTDAIKLLAPASLRGPSQALRASPGGSREK